MSSTDTGYAARASDSLELSGSPTPRNHWGPAQASWHGVGQEQQGELNVRAKIVSALPVIWSKDATATKTRHPSADVAPVAKEVKPPAEDVKDLMESSNSELEQVVITSKGSFCREVSRFSDKHVLWERDFNETEPLVENGVGSIQINLDALARHRSESGDDQFTRQATCDTIVERV